MEDLMLWARRHVLSHEDKGMMATIEVTP